jgi:hypothetical protein
MRIIVSLIVALLFFVGVGMVRYNAVVAQDDRVADSRRADCRRVADAALQANPYGDPDSFPRMRSDCERRAHETTMSERSIAHYILGAWLWGAIAGLVGGLLTYLIIRRRQRAAATG